MTRAILALVLATTLAACVVESSPASLADDVGVNAPDARSALADQPAALAAFVPEGGGPIAIGERAERVSSAACGECHAEEHAAWSRSAHARSHVDPLYVRERDRRPLRSCERCHAPLAAEVSPRTEGAWADEGVGCAACHVRDGVVVHSERSGRAPHETRIDARVSEVEGCRSCHQFHFPRPEPPTRLATFDPNDWLQDTVSEWASSEESRRGLGCVDCHLEGGDHTLPGHRDEAMLARALDVDVELRTDGAMDVVTLTLRSRAGHAVPTGDLYRVLEVRAWREGERARSVELGRRYERRGAQRVEVADDRVMPGEPRRVTLRLRRVDRADRPVSWAIRVWSVEPSVARRERLPDVVHELARGRVRQRTRGRRIRGG